MASKQYPLYNPHVSANANQLISETDLKRSLSEFYQVYNPSKLKNDSDLDNYLHFAAERGVLQLNAFLKTKYGCKLDEADNSHVGWLRVKKEIKAFYDFHGVVKTSAEIQKFWNFARKKGILELDRELKQKYGQSLTEFNSRRLRSWKNKWSSLLSEHQKDAMEYKFSRFFAFLEWKAKGNEELMSQLKNDPFFKNLEKAASKQPIEKINEQLLERYQICLDDIKLLKGNTKEERRVNLKIRLLEYYQKFAPDKINNVVNANAEVDLDTEAEEGVIRFEELNEDLFQRYGERLQDEVVDKLRERLITYYSNLGVRKELGAINDIIQYGFNQGLSNMNKHLVLKWGGTGIKIDDIYMS